MIKASLPDHSSILLVGSPGIGLLEFNISLLKDYLTEDVSVIFVTVDVLPSDILAMMGQFGVDTKAVLGKKLFVVDYHSSLLGSAEERSLLPKTEVRPVSDLEGIMFNVNSIASEHNRPVRVFLYTLSTLFLYNQSNVVLKFFQISSSKVRSSYGTMIFSIHDAVHDEKTVNHLMAIADGVIELKFDEDLNRRMRVRHMRGYPISSEWVPFEISGEASDTCPALLEWR